MPRVNTAVKSTRGKEIKCGRLGCGKKIEPGEKYFSWAFFRQAEQYRCKEHPPRQSELTQTNMSQAYAAVESVEDTLDNARTGKAEVPDIASALHDAASEVDAAKDAYQDSYDNLPENFQNADQGNDIQEKIDSLDSFHDKLEDAAGEVEALEGEDTEEAETKEGEEKGEENTKEDSALDKAIELAEDALGEFDQ